MLQSQRFNGYGIAPIDSYALVITSGAGLGVDSGLPEFRGAQGFWKAYPPYKKLGMNFVNAANPQNFAEDPELAWGFYGHRLQMYRETVPHQGFFILQEWIEKFQLDYFVITSNVDGHFQKTGVVEEKISEIAHHDDN